MVGKITAETRFGQMLICLRESKLNYVVRETPYSAEITIRKKFLKNVNEDAIENENRKRIESYEEFTKVEKDNSLMRRNVVELEKEKALLKNSWKSLIL